MGARTHRAIKAGTITCLSLLAGCSGGGGGSTVIVDPPSTEPFRTTPATPAISDTWTVSGSIETTCGEGPHDTTYITFQEWAIDWHDDVLVLDVAPLTVPGLVGVEAGFDRFSGSITAGGVFDLQSETYGSSHWIKGELCVPAQESLSHLVCVKGSLYLPTAIWHVGCEGDPAVGFRFLVTGIRGIATQPVEPLGSWRLDQAVYWSFDETGALNAPCSSVVPAGIDATFVEIEPPAGIPNGDVRLTGGPVNLAGQYEGTSGTFVGTAQSVWGGAISPWNYLVATVGDQLTGVGIYAQNGDPCVMQYVVAGHRTALPSRFDEPPPTLVLVNDLPDREGAPPEEGGVVFFCRPEGADRCEPLALAAGGSAELELVATGWELGAARGSASEDPAIVPLRRVVARADRTVVVRASELLPGEAD